MMTRRARGHSLPGSATRVGPAFILFAATLIAAVSVALPGRAQAASPGQTQAAPSGQAQGPAVHAVLFYSPTCPHCHKVMSEDLPPLTKKYGDRLVIAAVDVTTRLGQELYRATVDHFGVGPSRLGVPTLVVGDVVLVGSMEIPARFPDLIERGLAEGGVDWPDVAEVRQALVQGGIVGGDSTAAADVDTTTSDTATQVAASDTRGVGGDSVSRSAAVDTTRRTPERDTSRRANALPETRAAGARTEGPLARSEEPAADTAVDTTVAGTEPAGGAISVGLPSEPRRLGPVEAFRLDPAGNAAAVVVLVGLLLAVFIATRAALQRSKPARPLPTWVIPALAAVGMGVASYLAFVEVTGHEAVCGPVGNCNAVQQSSYAILFGVLPVGMLGQIGYLAMFAMWMTAELGPRQFASRAWKALWLLALVGTLFSAYLTFLEPFVIGATCAWCLTSSIVTALMLLAATGRVTPIRRSTALS